MKKFWHLILLSLLFSCKESKKLDYDKRHALIANINSKENLLTYSYWDDEDYAIKTEDLRNNKIIYSTKIQDVCFTEPRISNDKLYFPESNQLFTCVDYKTKKVIWKLPTKGRIREFQIVRDDIIIASVDVYGLIAINANTGKIMYELLLHSDKNCQVDFAPHPITFDEKYFYVADFNCTMISAYEISSGKKIWGKTKNSSISNFIVAGKYIFLGNNTNNGNGEIMLLEAETGKILFIQKSSFNIFIDPVFYQNKIYYHTEDSQLKEFDIATKKIFDLKKLDDLGCGQIFKIDHFLYVQDCDYNINKIDINSSKKEIVAKGEKGLLGVYKINDEVRFVY